MQEVSGRGHGGKDSRKVTKEMKIVWIIIGILVICFLGICIISIIENRKIVVTEYQITDLNIPEGFQNCRLLVLADLHNACFGKNNEGLLQMIREQQPDYILIAGDMIVGKPGQSTDVPASLIEELARDYPVYYAKGNHELRAGLYPDTYGTLWADYQKRLAGKVTWLVNERTALTRGSDTIWLYGLDIDSRYYRRFRHRPMEEAYLTKLLGEPEPEAYRILLAHNPDYFPAYAQWGANLVLSGHLHGGLIRLPWLGGMLSPMFHFFPRYDRGRYEEKNSVMLLSGGLGSHTFKFRVNNLPELLVITLSPGQDGTSSASERDSDKRF